METRWRVLVLEVERARRTAIRAAMGFGSAGTITLAPPSATSDIWTRRFPDPVTAFASGWMRVRARARQRGVERHGQGQRGAEQVLDQRVREGSWW